jgi:hypothetical protein
MNRINLKHLALRCLGMATSVASRVVSSREEEFYNRFSPSTVQNSPLEAISANGMKKSSAPSGFRLS